MSELLFFVLGLVIGGLTGVVMICMLQVNRINEYENKIKTLENKEER